MHPKESASVRLFGKQRAPSRLHAVARRCSVEPRALLLSRLPDGSSASAPPLFSPRRLTGPIWSGCAATKIAAHEPVRGPGNPAAGLRPAGNKCGNCAAPARGYPRAAAATGSETALGRDRTQNEIVQFDIHIVRICTTAGEKLGAEHRCAPWRKATSTLPVFAEKADGGRKMISMQQTVRIDCGSVIARLPGKRTAKE